MMLSPSQRPPPALDDSLSRARRMLADRIATSKNARMREPGSLPLGVGIGLNVADLPKMGRSYMNQYVSASLKMLKEYERKRQIDDSLSRTVEMSDSKDIFERAEDEAVKKLPLLSRKNRDAPPIPRGLKSVAEMNVDHFDRTSASSDALLLGRLRTLKRIASNDRVLEKVRLCHEAIDDDWAVAISEALGFNSYLVSLALVGNKITTVGGSRLAEAVSKHPNLTAVALGGNRLGDEVAYAFARALQKSSTLLVVNLTATAKKDDGHQNDGRIGPSGIRSLAMSLARIVELDLSWQNSGDAGASSLASALDTKSTLTFLSVDANNIGDCGISDLTRVLFSAKTSLRSLRLAGNAGTDKSALAVDNAFNSTKGEDRFLFLDLSSNKIGHDGCGRLGRVSRKMRLAFHGNPGYTTTSLLPVSRGEDGDSWLTAARRPLRHGETGQADTGLNLMHLVVKSTADEQRYEPFLKISTRAATARTKRELLARTPAYKRDKLALLRREKLGRFLPSGNLPPFEFLEMLKAHMLSSSRRNGFASNTLLLNGDTKGNSDEEERDTQTRRRRRCGMNGRRPSSSLSVEKNEKRVPRVQSFLEASFPRVLASHGARYGRLSTTRIS